MKPSKGPTAWAIVVAVILINAGDVVLGMLAGRQYTAFTTMAFGLVAAFVTLSVGVVLATRRSSNPIGWILLGSSVYFSVVGLATAYATYAFLKLQESPRAGEWAVVFEDRTWPLLFIGIAAIAYLFPDGRILEARRRWARLTAWSFAALTIAAIFSTDAFSAPFADVANPVPSIPGPVVILLFLEGSVGVLIGMVQAALSLRSRYKAATGVERLQMRWLQAAAATIPAAIAVGFVESAISGSDGPATFIALVVTLTAIPAAVGIAVMRYRLYEIDRVINRTLVYVTLTVLLATVFGVISLLVGVTAGSGSTIATAAATLVVVVVFNPLRARVQSAVDRRFDRDRFEGLRQVEVFLTDLRAGRGAPEEAAAVLSRALNDPGLELFYWVSEDAPSVDAKGIARDPDVREGRTMTPVKRGALRLGTVVHDARLSDSPDLLDSVIEAAGLAIEIGRLRAEVRRRLAEVEESRARIISAGVDERRRLERDLHDGAQQRLVSIGLEVRHIQAELGSEQRDADSALNDVVGEIGVAIEELRELARGVRPPSLDEGLARALYSLAERSPLPTSVSASPGALNEDVEAAAYFVASEALTNATKHSGAAAASIRASRIDGSLVLTVSDDGRGGARAVPGSGLEGIADRLAALGGRLSIESPPGDGTMITVELPCE